MADLDVGSMPVCDGEVLVGLLTDRDIAVRGVARGTASTTPVRDIMTSSIRYGFEDEPVEKALEMMRKHKIRRLPVLDHQRRLVGIVSLGDLAVDTDSAEAGEVLEEVSQPARPAR
jgi:CBS domain-containing protein